MYELCTCIYSYCCLDSAASTVSFAIMGIVTQIPQMTTDLQRTTRFGDVNCQATMGAITSFWGTYSGISSLASFSPLSFTSTSFTGYQCWRRFPKLVKERNGYLDYKWSMGPGFLCMLLATLLKLWDAVAHFALPTPAARHTKPPKEADPIIGQHMVNMAFNMASDMAFRSSNGQCDELYDYLILAYEGHESEMESSESGSDNA